MDYSDFPLHSWSCRKESMMHRCPRMALLHYFFSRGGGESTADPVTRRLHAMRSLLSMEEFCIRLLREGMRHLFYEEPDDSPFALEEAVLSRFSREFNHMLTGEYLRFGTPFLRELLQQKETPGKLARQTETLLRKKIALLTQNAWNRFSLVPMESHRFLPSPLRVQINDLPCFCAPSLAWEEKGEFWIIHSGKEEDTVALLYKFYGWNSAGIAPERLRCFSLAPDTGELREFGLYLDVSAALRRVEEGAAQWQELLHTPLTTLPRREKFCPECDFRSFCCEEGSGEPPLPVNHHLERKL